MHSPTPKPIRNKLDLTDPVQMRLVKKRLSVSDAELTAIVGRIGNSIAAISKEVAQQRANVPPKPAEVPPAAVIGSTGVVEPAAAEIPTSPPAS